MRFQLLLAFVHCQADVCLWIWSLLCAVGAALAGAWCGSLVAKEPGMPRPRPDWKTFSALVATLIALLAVLPSSAEFLNEQFVDATNGLAAVKERARSNWIGGALILYVVLLTLIAASCLVVAASEQRWAFAAAFAPLVAIVAVLAVGLTQDLQAVLDAR